MKMGRRKYNLVVVHKSGVVQESSLKLLSVKDVWNYAEISFLFRDAPIKLVCRDGTIISSSYPLRKFIGDKVNEVIDSLKNKIKKKE